MGGRRRVLVAGTQQAIETVQHIFAEDFELVPARSIDEALGCLKEPTLAERPETRAIPVICCRTAPEALSREMRRSKLNSTTRSPPRRCASLPRRSLRGKQG